MKLKEAIADLEKLKDQYDDLKEHIVDQIRDDEINDAKNMFRKLVEYKQAIDQMCNIDIELRDIKRKKRI